jgi:hypothetical protein
MDEANARHYIAAYVAMRSGEPYTYSIKDSAVEHALRELFETEGQKGLALAINAVDGYLKNYMRIKGVERRSLKDLILPWRRKIT